MIRQTKEGLWIIDGDKWISAWVEEHGSLHHDHQTLPLVLHLINKGDVVVDVGANIGDSTGPFLERVGDQGKVFAFEPHPEAFACLVKNCPQASCYQVALSHETVVYPFQRKANVGASHICQNAEDRVQAVTLDSFKLEKCDAIKVDCEGFEAHVLKGARRTIRDYKPIIVMEINEGALRRHGLTQFDIFDLLTGWNYQWWPLVGADIGSPNPQYDIVARWIDPDDALIPEDAA